MVVIEETTRPIANDNIAEPEVMIPLTGALDVVEKLFISGRQITLLDVKIALAELDHYK